MRSCPFLQPMKWRHSAMTSSVQKAATRSSNMIPQPPRQPKPLKHRSAHLTGWGLAASKKRNSAKAMSWPQKPVGMTSHSTSQKATISSQTRLPGSATRMWRAVTVQAHQRSEEHTSELQSHSDLVCRLLLEKKKKKEEASNAKRR